MTNGTRIPLTPGPGHIDVDHHDAGVEVTITSPTGRVCFSIALTHREAEALGMALARPDGPTVSDLRGIARSLGTTASELVTR